MWRFKTEEGGSLVYCYQGNEFQPLATIKKGDGGEWVILGHEEHTFRTLDEAKQNVGIASAFDYIPRLLRPTVPRLYSTENQGSGKLARIKLFTPWTYWTWYICEAGYLIDGQEVPVSGLEWSQDAIPDADDVICFGVVHGHEREYGNFSLRELVGIRGPVGLRIERDLFFKPVPVSEVGA